MTADSPFDLWFPQMAPDGRLLASHNDEGPSILDLSKPPGERKAKKVKRSQTG